MVTHANNVRAQVALLINSARSVPEAVWCEFTPEQQRQALNVYVQKIEQLISDELPLAIARDESDVIFHAEGPALKPSKYRLAAFNSVVDAVNGSILELVAGNLAKLGPSDMSLRMAKQQVAIELSGLAPGSLFVGAKVTVANKAELFDKDMLREDIDSILQALPQAASFVKGEQIDSEIQDAIVDPFLRDSALIAACSIAPTGKRGVDSVTIFPKEGIGVSNVVLTPTKRQVIRQTIRQGGIGDRVASAKIEGVVREVNLDTRRFLVRSSEGILVRCFLKGLDKQKASGLLGQKVSVSGAGEKDKEGRMRFVSLESDPIILQSTTNS